MRLIDADNLKEDIKENGCDCFETWDKMLTLAEYETFVGDVIDNAPTVEDRTREVLSLQETIRKLTQERPHGGWIHPYITDIACECSNCHLRLPITDYFNFCPNCGADMRGER